MELKKSTALWTTGSIWMVMSAYLCGKGFFWLWMARQNSAVEEGWQNGRLLSIVALASVIGFYKGNFLLAKTAKRLIQRLEQFPEKIPLNKLYDPRYYILLGVMALLGIVLNRLPIAWSVRGGIDIAIGVALFTGSIFYFKHAMMIADHK